MIKILICKVSIMNLEKTIQLANKQKTLKFISNLNKK